MTVQSGACTENAILLAMRGADAPRVVFALRRGLMTYNGATPWTTAMGLGSPAQNLRFMIDTGTKNTWITSAVCTTDACRAHRAFDPTLSSTYTGGTKIESVDFGPWGTMSILKGSDICHLDLETSGVRSTLSLDDRITIELAVEYQGDQFRELDCDGGLAIPSVPDDQSTALLELLGDSKQIPYRIASFDTDPISGKGVCLMGALDASRFDPSSLDIVPLQTLTGSLDYLWCVALDTLACNGAPAVNKLALALDTGSSCFKGSQTLIDQIRACITQGGKLPEVVSSEAQLQNYPSVQLYIHNHCYNLNPKDYFLQIQPSVWVLGFQVLNGLPDDLLVVGSVFLDTVYSIFCYDEPKCVGLARPVRPTPTPVDPFSPLTGTWINEFNSQMIIGPVAADGTFTGIYKSTTGATGEYYVTGVVDPEPDVEGKGLPVAYSISWRSRVGFYDPSWHWVSAFAGNLHKNPDGSYTLKTIYLLQKDTPSSDDWEGTVIYPSTYRRV